MSISVLIADDQALVRAGFRMILDAEPDIHVVGEAKDGHEAVALTRELRPNVTLMDIRMPGLDGLEATRQILQDGERLTQIIMLTTFDRNQYVYEALRAGASGFLVKDAPTEQLLAAIHVVAAGDALLAPSVTRALIEEFVRLQPRPQDATAQLQELTPRELEVFDLMARGKSNTEIAETFVLSETTIKTHVARILMKLDLRDRVQAVVLAYETGHIRPGAH
ncbi:MAG: response regulator transcription factor [Actinomycetota bacterium]|nr:response regulator transcription factor [Actinomycetota bacterium]